MSKKKGRGNNLKRHEDKSISTETRDYGFIQAVTRVKNTAGDFEDSWANTHPNLHSMGITPTAAKQVYEYDSINVEASHLIKMRFEIPVSQLNRIVSEGVIYEILAIENIQQRGVLNWIWCKERLD